MTFATETRSDSFTNVDTMTSFTDSRLILWMAVLLLGWMGCQSEQPKEAPAPEIVRETPASEWMVMDTVTMKYTDAVVDSIKAAIYNHKTTRDILIFTKGDSPVDSFTVRLLDREIINVSIPVFNPAQEAYNDIFFENGEMVYFRYREWNKRPEASSAREIYFYFRDGEQLYFALERGKVLAPGIPPADLLWDPMLPCTRTLESAQFYLNQYWPELRKQMMEELKEKGEID